jgi:hypothetical protein
VQVGAYGSPDRAKAGWRVLRARVTRLDATEQRIVPAGRIYKLQAAGLPNRAEADALCRAVRRARSACLVIAP